MERLRLDQMLVRRGLASDAREAEALILRGLVRVDGRRVDKAGTPVTEEAEIRVGSPPRYVSRGGDKLEAALAASGLDPTGLICLDLGASTGGFTDCLLQNGARRVYALDVGRGQLDWNIRMVRVLQGIAIAIAKGPAPGMWRVGGLIGEAGC